MKKFQLKNLVPGLKLTVTGKCGAQVVSGTCTVLEVHPRFFIADTLVPPSENCGFETRITRTRYPLPRKRNNVHVEMLQTGFLVTEEQYGRVEKFAFGVV